MDYRIKDIRFIGEFAGAVFSGGALKHVLLTGGCLNYQKEIELVTEILKSIREHTGFDRVLGTILISPARSWFIEAILEASEYMYSANVPSGSENHCYRCDGNSLLHDALRLKGIG